MQQFLPIPTFTEAAELAGISRVMGYHIQADNVAGLGSFKSGIASTSVSISR